jgi:hypothetical protein
MEKSNKGIIEAVAKLIASCTPENQPKKWVLEFYKDLTKADASEYEARIKNLENTVKFVESVIGARRMG